jgi:hypothetical protein
MQPALEADGNARSLVGEELRDAIALDPRRESEIQERVSR